MRHVINELTRGYFSRRTVPYWSILIIDCLLVMFASVMTFALYDGPKQLLDNLLPLMATMGCYLVFYLVGFRVFRTYSGIIRYSSFVDLMRIAYANALAMALIYISRHVTPIDDLLVPLRWRLLLSTFVLATAFMWSMRIFIKYLFDRCFLRATARRVFIYGAREGGIAIAKGLATQEGKFQLMGFISDDAADARFQIMGKRVFLNDESLIKTMRSKGVDMVIVSPLKSQALRDNPDMVSRLTAAGVHIMVYSSQEWDGKSDIQRSQLKDVEIEDLLPRAQIEVDMEAIKRELTGHCILITGAAGSIGSEIVRQVASFGPSQLVLIDQAETPLHDIRLMMARNFANIPCLTLTASICNKSHMEHVFAEYKPQFVFHAAAYKHVPMMEDNPGEAIYNNVEGTRIMADLAVKHGVQKFVMISTDKAVNPTNVMGCSKRICEMYCQSLDKKLKEQGVPGATQFVTTRFGNVLGSNGSVIPLFREQIKAGGPVTVTDPNIIRYFMLIPEACKLVLEAGTMGRGGEIFVFDMGKPVKIADLAKRMILLSGAQDVEIKYTGLRDGEKLYEELLNEQENTTPSSHPKIKVARVRELGYDEVSAAIDQLIASSTTYDDMLIVKGMKALVPEFKSNHSKYEVLDAGK